MKEPAIYNIELIDEEANLIDSFDSYCIPYITGQTINILNVDNAGFDVTRLDRDYLVTRIEHAMEIRTTKKDRVFTNVKHNVSVTLLRISK